MKNGNQLTTLFIRLSITSHDMDTVPSLRRRLPILEVHQGHTLGTLENLSDIQMLKTVQSCCGKNTYKGFYHIVQIPFHECCGGCNVDIALIVEFSQLAKLHQTDFFGLSGTLYL